MNKTTDSLTDDEVRQIALLIETIDRSTMDFLQVDAAGVRLTISKGGAGLTAMAPATPPMPVVPPATLAAVAPLAQSSATVAPPSAAAPASPSPGSPDNTVVIPAPLMGRFYPRPEPGAPAFVTVGSEVEEDTVVGLIEVMKLFNTVQAGMRGTITEVCAPEGEFLEYGAPLFRVRPADASNRGGA
jgi:acetyl-CoA carboxylase biotin carboxyl carrier protein